MDNEEIKCMCNDAFCIGEGLEGEVAGHVESCSCGHCHRLLGKVSPFMELKPEDIVEEEEAEELFDGEDLFDDSDEGFDSYTWLDEEEEDEGDVF